MHVIGETVRAFDPRTLGVVKIGRIVKIGPKWAVIDFGLSGSCKIAIRDIIESA